ncbi:MAG: hypothetical protein J5777_00045 [Clostridiales bacterium]|nr:hypothetical protein [Clostridiales bacterium]
MDIEAFQNKELVAKLPQEGVHCYAGNPGKIMRNRVVSLVMFALSAALAAVGLINRANGMLMLILACVGILLAICFILVFCQTFLVAKFRVAVDYNNKNIVLRYRYSKILIPFENFDARDGAPDQAEAMIDKNFNKEGNAYLVLDDVFEDACYQTSIADLESKEDFEKLKADCFAIAEAYGARNSKDKVKFYYEKDDEKGLSGDADMDAIIEEARNEQKAAKVINPEDDDSDESSEGEDKEKK